MLIDKEKLKTIDQFLTKMIEDEQIPGAVYGIVTKEGTIAENALGHAHKDLKIPMTLETIFDLASLTKICATTPSIYLLIEKGLIDIDDPVKRFFPESASSDLTIKHLLTHTSGLPPHVPFYKLGLSKEKILNFIINSEVNLDEQVIYSDLNFILLGFIIEKVTGVNLDEFSYNSIYEPLGMTHTGFNLKGEQEQFAPTEWIEEEQAYKWGAVHDENAFHLSGVSGHAGLFSNLSDLKKYVQILLRDGKTKTNQTFLSSAILKESQRPHTSHLNLQRGLGFQLVDDAFSPLGYFLSKKSYGHTGFTGTSIWIDPEREIGVILLSNRVHISRSINMNRIRRIVHNLIAFAIS